MSNQKQKLAELVMQKMKQKKEAEQRNRPHFQVLQLDVQFSLEQNDMLKTEIAQLTATLNKQTNLLNELKQNLQQLQNTGKKNYPFIIVKPQFIASQNVPISFKEFYRKSSNTFLKADMIKTQKHQIYLERQKQILQTMATIVQIQNHQIQESTKNIKIMQQKRTKVLKQDIRRRLMIEQQQKIEDLMERLKIENKPLLREYQIKKENLQNRIAYSHQLVAKIKQKKEQIQTKYNPVSYREYLKKIFSIRVKNQHIEKNLVELIGSLNQAERLSDKFKVNLQRKSSITFIGKASNSPSKIKGKMQKDLQKQSVRRSNTNPKNISELINLKSNVQKSQALTKRSKSFFNQEVQDRNSRTLIKIKTNRKQKNYSSMKTLKQAFQNTLKSDRTLSTTLAMSSAKKKFIDF